MKYRILIADDEQKIRRVIDLLLKEAGYETLLAENGKEAVEAVATFQPHLILLDYNMPEMTGIEALERIRENDQAPTVVMITAFGSVSLVVEAIKKGAYDFIEKPFDNDKLLLTVKRALEHTVLKKEVNDLKEKINLINGPGQIIGESGGLRRVMEQVRMVAATNATVLLTGESGSGKELISRSIHQLSNRRNRPFIAVNCGAIPMSLIESELFGFEKGAFTDAREAHAGTFEKADRGTLFLDEVGELPMDAQVKLLRVLEEKRITRIGGKNPINIDVRIIAATNRILEDQVKSGSFRLDLFYRLNVFSINLPPLRERKDDILHLTAFFIKKYNQLLSLSVEGIAPESLELLQQYNWPGNVRDLENAVQSAIILTQQGLILPKALPPRVKSYSSDRETGLPNSDTSVSIRDIGFQAEKDLIANVLKKNSNNRTTTAKELNISRKTLFNKMKKYGLK